MSVLKDIQQYAIESVMCKELNLFITANRYILICLKELYSNVYLCKQSLISGGYRSRTDDPLRARQVL